MRLIDADEIKKIISKSVSEYSGEYSTDMINMWGLFTQIIDNAPTVEDRQSGRWIYHKADGCFLPQMECSVCGATDILAENITPQHFRKFYVYCWNCGAKMKGAEE